MVSTPVASPRRGSGPIPAKSQPAGGSAVCQAGRNRLSCKQARICSTRAMCPMRSTWCAAASRKSSPATAQEKGRSGGRAGPWSGGRGARVLLDAPRSASVSCGARLVPDAVRPNSRKIADARVRGAGRYGQQTAQRHAWPLRRSLCAVVVSTPMPVAMVATRIVQGTVDTATCCRPRPESTRRVGRQTGRRPGGAACGRRRHRRREFCVADRVLVASSSLPGPRY